MDPIFRLAAHIAVGGVALVLLGAMFFERRSSNDFGRAVGAVALLMLVLWSAASLLSEVR